MIKLLQNIKLFYIALDYVIANIFFYSQSKISNIIIDEFYGLIKRIKRQNVDIIEDNLRIEIDRFDEIKTKRTDFSNGEWLDNIPNYIHSIIKKNEKFIKGILGEGFVHDKAMIYETFNVEEVFSKHDIYANIWHMDSHVGNKLLVIMVLLDDVDENGGPFIYLNREETKKNWDKLRVRYKFNKEDAIKIYDKENKFTGNKGSYLILNTAKCSHRASIPKKSRKMLTISLYPSWRHKINRGIDRETYNFIN
ncbi:hypothetical protein OAU78_03675 [Candidatus Pelagibacter sp.]|nr:hypothetical protein [Candidatus Pelagibacter sp.]